MERIVPVRAKPTTMISTTRIQQVHIAVKIFEVFVHRDYVLEAHCFDFPVREFFTDEASDLSSGFRQLALVGFYTYYFRSSVVVREDRAFKDRDLERDPSGRTEVVRHMEPSCVLADVKPSAFKASDPIQTSRVVACDREVDDLVFFAPLTNRFGNDQFPSQKIEGCFVTTQFLDDGIQLTCSEAGRCEFSIAHD